MMWGLLVALLMFTQGDIKTCQTFNYKQFVEGGEATVERIKVCQTELGREVQWYYKKGVTIAARPALVTLKRW